ncbi:uncharacterized protein LOC105844767 [Hydra vulgaris]|uniref:Uncharacterized protein LOC105844767 n=1 Tax=Hydra vulgaris TaxID=6087 RepID=A0ABM4CNH8_HYDVU
MGNNEDEFTWKKTEYKLKFVIDNPNFVLPQVVRVIQGYMVDEDDALASGQILILHGKKQIVKVFGKDENGKCVNIPLNCPYEVKLISLGERTPYTCIGDICKKEKIPPLLKTHQDITLPDGTHIASNSLIETKNKVFSDSEDLIGLLCSAEDDAKSFILPSSLKGLFTECISKDASSKSFLLSEVIKEYGLPIEIQFTPVSDKNCSYGPHLGPLKLDEKNIYSSVYATSVIDGVRYAMTFSAELPVTVQVSTGVNEMRAYASKNKINLTKFDYDENDPYSLFTIKNQVSDEAKYTPRTRRQNSTISIKTYRSCPAQITGQTQKAVSDTSGKRNKGTELSKDFEKLVKAKFGFNKLRRSMSRFRDKNPVKQTASQRSNSIDFDNRSSSMTSEDGSSSTGDYSVDVTSTGSGSINGSFQHIIECMDALSTNHHMSRTPSINRHSRKSSSDSGICVRARKQQNSYNKSNYNNQDRCDSDNISQWSIKSQTKNVPTAAYLWSSDGDDQNNNSKVSEVEHSSEKHFILKNTHEINAPIESSPLTTTRVASMEEIRSLSEEGVMFVLDTLKLSEFKDTFRKNQINGELLLCLDQDELVSELKLSLFQAKKLINYVKGWRPQCENLEPSEISRRISLNPKIWSENDVYTHLKTINLADLGDFLRLNQVNGELLLNILDKDTLLSLQNDHAIKISSLESKKLLNFVVNGWRPDSLQKKTAKLV